VSYIGGAIRRSHFSKSVGTSCFILDVEVELL
jgi:hypothetical protein